MDSDSFYGGDNDNNEAMFKDVEWSDEHVKILIDWADKAMCFQWLHAQANAKLTIASRWFTIPVIIISTITGTANFAQDRVPTEYVQYFVMVVGALNIIAGIISTVSQFLKINELNESHRISSISWDKFYRNIRVELAKNPKERIPVGQMLKMCKEEFDRLMETSPSIQVAIIQKFNQTFKNNKNFNMIKKPEICDELVSTEQFIYIQEKVTDKKSKSKPFIELMKRKREMDKQKETIANFILQFKAAQGREPLLDEVVEEMKDNIEEERIKVLFKSVIDQGAATLISELAKKKLVDHDLDSPTAIVTQSFRDIITAAKKQKQTQKMIEKESAKIESDLIENDLDDSNGIEMESVNIKIEK